MDDDASPAPASPHARPVKGLKAKQAPFRLFFLVAALDAVVGAALWLVLDLGLGIVNGTSATEWHRTAFLFGMVPAILAGFLLTALPRWTGHPAAAPLTVRLLAGLWLLGRTAALFSSTAGLVAAAAFVLSLTLITAACVIAGRDRRNLKVVLLLSCFSTSAFLTAAPCCTDLALRAAVASVVGLLAIIGGRVVPALTESYVHSIGGQPVIGRSLRLDTAASAAMACALASWVTVPQTALTGFLCAIAALGQALRLAQWRGWQAGGNWSILALHIGYSWIAVGFALLAIHVLAPEHVAQAAAVHAWTIGAIGTSGLAIMSSMIRKHAGRSFVASRPATASFVCVSLSSLSRQISETSPLSSDTWLAVSAALWIGAFGLFLAAWRRELWARHAHDLGIDESGAGDTARGERRDGPDAQRHEQDGHEHTALACADDAVKDVRHRESPFAKGS